MIRVDTSGVNKIFGKLTGKEQKKVIRTATREAAKKLSKATKQTFKTITKKYNSRNWWNGKTLQSGIKHVSDKKVSYKVHIMGDFRLKFWEMGTKARYTRKGHYRGIFKKKAFFDPTQQRLETTLANDIKDSITKNLINHAQSR